MAARRKLYLMYVILQSRGTPWILEELPQSSSGSSNAGYKTFSSPQQLSAFHCSLVFLEAFGKTRSGRRWTSEAEISKGVLTTDNTNVWHVATVELQDVAEIAGVWEYGYAASTAMTFVRVPAATGPLGYLAGVSSVIAIPAAGASISSYTCCSRWGSGDRTSAVTVANRVSWQYHTRLRDLRTSNFPQTARPDIRAEELAADAQEFLVGEDSRSWGVHF
jgi:hypothetical protein